jgi:hypothetical protein
VRCGFSTKSCAFHRPRCERAGGLLEPCSARARAAFRNRKYFRTNCPSRATSGPLQIPHVVLRSTISGSAFVLTTWYRALQFGQRKSGDLFGLGIERPQHFCFAPRGEHCAARSKAGDLSQSESPHRLFALIHFRIRLRVRNTDHKTMVEKSMNDGSAIGGSCRGELRVIRFGHCHAALPTVEGPQFRKSAGGDRSH